MAYVGNFGPSHSTENDVAASWNQLGHRVLALQENDPRAWQWLLKADLSDVDLVMWTRTWHLPHLPQVKAMIRVAEQGVPAVGYHLDLWHGLDREHQVRDEPFFTSTVAMFTADGGHDRQWAKAGINHHWLPPGINAANIGRARAVRGACPEIVFMGSNTWYHKEWPHRMQLVAFLRETYGRRVGIYPHGRGGAIRGRQLATIYGTASVLVGDSCLVGKTPRLVSDRIPESLGRGGFLLHPHVAGITDGAHYRAGKHLDTWTLGDWTQLKATIDYYLTRPGLRRTISDAGMAHVAQHHSYAIRMGQVLAVCERQGLLPRRSPNPVEPHATVTA